ncbi:hypothetical protein [Brevibacillus laterosporus]|nr:hypothetical protein [Brevibacillus laterosporus]
MSDVFLTAFEYAAILTVPITLLTVVALADELTLLVKRAVAPYVRKRRR